MAALLVAGGFVSPLASQADSAGPAPTEQVAATRFEHVFGAADGSAPGFRIEFDRRGATVRRVELLDHFEGAPGEPGDDVPYKLVEIEFLDPSDPARGAFAWMTLEAVDADDPDFGALRVPLADLLWELAEQSAERVVFRVPVGDDLVLEKAFTYDPIDPAAPDAEPRRDLGFELALRRSGGSAGPAKTFVLDGLALQTPKTEALYGHPAMGVGGTRTGEGDVSIKALRAPSGPVELEAGYLAGRQLGGSFDFAGTTNRFFGAFLFATDAEAQRAVRDVTTTTVPELPQQGMDAFSVPQSHYAIEVPDPAAGSEARVSLRLYLGPKSYPIFAHHQDYERFDAVLDESLDPACCSIPGTRTIAWLLMWVLYGLHSGVGNWGLAIMCLTVLVRGSLFPLNFRMQKSMRAYGKKMAVVKPKMEALQKRYANDPKKLQQEMMAFNKEHGLFPPLGGCLPMFLTMPIYFGLFSSIRVSYELRHQPFVAWINDLSRPDSLFATGLTEMTGWNSIGTFNLLPICYMALMFYIVSRTPLPTDPQQRQMQTMMRFMPMLFGVMLYGYAAGMFVYMLTSGLWTLVEQRIVKKILGPIDPNAAAMAGAPVM